MDRTQYCELCEAARKEIARLESVVYDLNCTSAQKEREIAELKAERLKPIDEAIARLGSWVASAELDNEPCWALAYESAVTNLKDIRAKYAGGK